MSAGVTIIQRPCDESKRDQHLGHCFDPVSSEFRIFNVAPGAALSLVRVTVRGGQADLGGGIYNDRGSLTLIESTVMGNTAHDNGGGIYNTGRLWLQDSTVRDNFVHHYSGGGIYNAGEAVIHESTISGNKVADDGFGNRAHGGGIYNVYNNDANGVGSLEIVNSTIFGNTAAGLKSYGGGIANSERDAWLDNVTITANNAAFGGGVYVAEGPDFYFFNTIIAGNGNGFNQSGPDCVGELTTLRGNLVGDIGASPFPCKIVDWPYLQPGAQGDLIGGKNTSKISKADVFWNNFVTGEVPLLRDYGGPTCTVALCIDGNCLFRRNSLAIGRAWQQPPPGSAAPACAAKDQRGATRGDHCDIGAYQARATITDKRYLVCSGL